MNIIADIIGWVGNIFFIAGAILISRKKISGFYNNAIGNLFYVFFGVMAGTPSIVILSVFLIGTNIYGIKYWKKNKRQDMLAKKYQRRDYAKITRNN
ncbi:hypothetical protein LCGC14_0667070 [marine sediment metagenome]|uniref:Uncharacterized protein n=1 Tax=marine sediment metagenome TaxID=412755 RepID=A0A0F9QRY3_9ZZZZ